MRRRGEGNLSPRDSLTADTLPGNGTQSPPPDPVVDIAYARKTPSLPLKDLVNDLVRETAAASLARDNAEPEPSLNLLSTTPKNFSRFVLCVGPVFSLLESIQDILSWTDISTTIIAWVSFAVACAYPFLAALFPLFIAVYIVVVNYYRRTRDYLQGISRPRVQPSHKELVTKNMTRIQNSMGLYCDVAHEVERFADKLDWVDPTVTKSASQAFILAAGLVSLLLLACPIRLLILIGGSMAFVVRTALFRAIALIILRQDYVQALLRRLFPFMLEGRGMAAAYTFSNLDKPASEHEITVETFENQRWWVGVGWTDKLLPTERSHYSDETGNISRPKSGFALLPGYVWKDDWRLEVPRGADDEGWIYADNAWADWSPTKNLTSFTRRRRWTRVMSPVPR